MRATGRLRDIMAGRKVWAGRCLKQSRTTLIGRGTRENWKDKQRVAGWKRGMLQEDKDECNMVSDRRVVWWIIAREIMQLGKRKREREREKERRQVRIDEILFSQVTN